MAKSTTGAAHENRGEAAVHVIHGRRALRPTGQSAQAGIGSGSGSDFSPRPPRVRAAVLMTAVRDGAARGENEGERTAAWWWTYHLVRALNRKDTAAVRTRHRRPPRSRRHRGQTTKADALKAARSYLKKNELTDDIRGQLERLRAPYATSTDDAHNVRAQIDALLENETAVEIFLDDRSPWVCRMLADLDALSGRAADGDAPSHRAHGLGIRRETLPKVDR